MSHSTRPLQHNWIDTKTVHARCSSCQVMCKFSTCSWVVTTFTSLRGDFSRNFMFLLVFAVLKLRITGPRIAKCKRDVFNTLAHSKQMSNATNNFKSETDYLPLEYLVTWSARESKALLFHEKLLELTGLAGSPVCPWKKTNVLLISHQLFRTKGRIEKTRHWLV